MIARLVFWFEDRLRGESATKIALRKVFPDHWSFMLGEIAMYCFLVLIATGTLLGFLFNPSGDRTVYNGPYPPLHGVQVSGAYASMLRISFEDRAGLLVRQIHHWAALVFVAAIVIHMMRVFFTGAFRKPREINWVIGLTLLILAMGAGFTGYSLPDDLLSGTGLKIAESIALSIPFAGNYVAELFFGGRFPNQIFSGRLFFDHVFLLPSLMIGLLALHLAIIWRQKHTQFRGPKRTEQNVVGSHLWPNYALKSLGLLCGVIAMLALLGGFVQINPVWIYGPYDPWQVASPAQPDWFVGWLEGAMRIGPAWTGHLFGHEIATPFVPAVVFPGAIFLLLYAWPFLEAFVTRDTRRHNLLDLPHHAPLRTAVGVWLLSGLAVLLFAGSDDLQANFFHVSVEGLVNFYRVAIFVVPVLCAVLAYRVCIELGLRERDVEKPPPRVVLVRTESGGYEEEKRPLTEIES